MRFESTQGIGVDHDPNLHPTHKKVSYDSWDPASLSNICYKQCLVVCQTINEQKSPLLEIHPLNPIITATTHQAAAISTQRFIHQLIRILFGILSSPIPNKRIYFNSVSLDPIQNFQSLSDLLTIQYCQFYYIITSSYRIQQSILFSLISLYSRFILQIFSDSWRKCCLQLLFLSFGPVCGIRVISGDWHNLASLYAPPAAILLEMEGC